MTVLAEIKAQGWVDVGAVEDIPLRGARQVFAADGPVAVFRTGDDRIFALRDRCPHKQGPLSQGIVHGRSASPGPDGTA